MSNTKPTPLVLAALAASVIMGIAAPVGAFAVTHHCAQVREARAAADVRVAMRSSAADHPSPAREPNAVEGSVAIAEPEITVEEVTVVTPTKVAHRDTKKSRNRASLWSSIKGFFGKHA